MGEIPASECTRAFVSHTYIHNVSEPDWRGRLMGGLDRLWWVAVAGLEAVNTDSKKQANREVRVLDQPNYQGRIGCPHILPRTRLNWSARVV